MSYSSEAIVQPNEARAPMQEPDPRKSELAAFERVTSGLIDNQDKDPSDQEYLEALKLNRRLWSALESDLGSRENQLPDELKAKLISVAMWVDRHSALVEQGKAKIESLIEINQSIMKGLQASTEFV